MVLNVHYLLQSVDVAYAAYEMDWSLFNSSAKKITLMIMAQSLNPIKFSSGYVVILSIDSFNSVSMQT